MIPLFRSTGDTLRAKPVPVFLRGMTYTLAGTRNGIPPGYFFDDRRPWRVIFTWWDRMDSNHRGFLNAFTARPFQPLTHGPQKESPNVHGRSG